MRFGFQRQYGIDLLDREIIGLIGRQWGELLDGRAGIECYIVFIGRHQLVRVLGRCFFDQSKEGMLLFFAVDNEGTTEDFMPAMLGIHLRKPEHFAVGQVTFQFFAYFIEVAHLVGAQRKSFLLVVGRNIVDIHDRIRLPVDREQLLVKVVIDMLQHRVMSLLRREGNIFFDTRNSFQAHVLRDFDSIRAPRRDHLTTRPDKSSLNHIRLYRSGAAEQPD